MAIELTITELETESGGLLPAREALSIGVGNVNATGIIAGNTALALNAASVGSQAAANAGQAIFVAQ